MERVNHLAVTEAILMQQVVSSIFSKDAASAFKKTVKDMTDG